jgi:hypothetical protein
VADGPQLQGAELRRRVAVIESPDRPEGVVIVLGLASRIPLGVPVVDESMAPEGGHDLADGRLLGLLLNDRRGGQAALIRQPFGDQLIVLLPRVGGAEFAEIDLPAVDTDPGLPRGLVFPKWGTALTSLGMGTITPWESG